MKLKNTPCTDCGNDEFYTHDYPVIYCSCCEKSWTEEELRIENDEASKGES